MKNLTTRLVAVSGAFAIALGAAACSKSDTPTPSAKGSSSSSTSSAGAADSGVAPKAADILEKAKTNALAASSGAFSGDVEQGGKKINIDFKGTSDGRTADISIEMEGDGKARVISVPDGVYIQGDAAFWKKQGAPAKVQNAGDKFVKAPASAAAMTQSLSLKSFLQKAFGAVTPQQLAKTVKSENVGGVDCWVVTDTKGEAEGALYVSKDAFQVVRFTGSKSNPGQLDFSSWNTDLGIKAPPAAQVISLG